jgi:acetyl esterase/lipase
VEIKMLRNFLVLAAIASIAACAARPQAASSTAHGSLMGPAQFQALPSNPADHRIAYGKDPQQFGDLRIPAASGSQPVVVLIHGGCWKSDYATLSDMAPMADALKTEGIATWNIEYRRLPGSGWPGTFQDVAAAVDHLRAMGPKYQLDPERVVVVGHSAGGHLALWVAAREGLPSGSLLRGADPLPVRGVVDLAGPGDLRAEIAVEVGGCQSRVVEELIGGSPAEVPERYREASPSEMLPLGVPQVLVWGTQDTLRPLWVGEAYAKAAAASGDQVRLLTVDALGHFEIASPHSRAWPKVLHAIRSLLRD